MGVDVGVGDRVSISYQIHMKPSVRFRQNSSVFGDFWVSGDCWVSEDFWFSEDFVLKQFILNTFGGVFL